MWNDEKLFKLLEQKSSLKKKEIEALVYSLIEIKDSFEKIYNSIIPNMLKISGNNTELLQDLLWDLREEFRHIDYHIQDSKILDL